MEVMITLLILAIGLLGLAALQIVAIRGNTFGSQMTYASVLAQRKLEELKGLPSTDIKLQAGDHPNPQESSDSWYQVQEKGITYQITHTVQDDTPNTGMKTIKLTITWTGATQGGVGQHSATFNTVISY